MIPWAVAEASQLNWNVRRLPRGRVIQPWGPPEGSQETALSCLFIRNESVPNPVPGTGASMVCSLSLSFCQTAGSIIPLYG